jgi:hypothetical protein
MKRFFLSLLLLAGLGFACEQTNSELRTDASTELETKKEALAQDLKRLKNIKIDIDANDLQRLKAFKASHADLNTLPEELLTVVPAELKILAASIADQARNLQHLMDPEAMSQYLDGGWHSYLGQSINGESDCEAQFTESCFNSIISYFGCGDAPYCVLFLAFDLVVIQAEYEACLESQH